MAEETKDTRVVKTKLTGVFAKGAAADAAPLGMYVWGDLAVEKITEFAQRDGKTVEDYETRPVERENVFIRQVAIPVTGSQVGEVFAAADDGGKRTINRTVQFVQVKGKVVTGEAAYKGITLKVRCPERGQAWEVTEVIKPIEAVTA